MNETLPPSDELEQLFLQYLQELDRSDAIDLEKYLKSLQLSAESSQELRALIETAKIVKEMAGPRVTDEEQELITTNSHLRVDSEETFVVDHPASLSESAGRHENGATLGEYEIREELGRGGMGVVYKAHQVNMGREVALKMIRSGCLASEEDIQRFYFEARSAGKLKHPSIVQVYQVGEIDGHHYFTMEYIEGDTLSRYIAKEGPSPTQVAEMMVKVAEAVDFAHQHGVLHRDLKPSNVLVDAQGNPRITDFGLAKDMNSSEQLTSSGSTLGTPSYMPPEQAQALRDKITCRSDVYSLGAMLYAMLTKRPPFKADSLVETLTQVIHDDPVPLRDIDASIPRDLEAICLKCLNKSPTERYATAQELSEDLQRFLSGEAITARRNRWYDRVWQWLRNVPMIAAMLGRKSASSTTRHFRFQWGVMTLAISVLLGMILFSWANEVRRFSVVDISTGGSTRTYHRIGLLLADELNDQLGKEVNVKTSVGAVESHGRLLSAEADIAFLQENTLESEDLKVLAPLYKEAVLIILRGHPEVNSVRDLKGLHIALGEPGSGMRISSRQLLNYFGISEEALKNVDRKFTDLAKDQELDGAIVTIKIDDHDLHALLETGQFRLLKLQQDDIPGFRSIRLKKRDLPGDLVSQEGWSVPATFAILAVRDSTPDRYVTDVLEALYTEGGISEEFEDIYSLQAAAKWKDLNYHNAAQRFFSKVRKNSQRMNASEKR